MLQLSESFAMPEFAAKQDSGAGFTLPSGIRFTPTISVVLNAGFALAHCRGSVAGVLAAEL